MSRFLVAALVAVLFVSVGCQDKDKSDSDTKAMSADACPKCPGVQKANAAGKCPDCGAAVSAAAVDACSHCAGVQVANADGKCPGCGAKVK